jgi:hypothetical protein
MKVQNNIVGYGVAATAALLTASIGFIDKNDSTILDLAIFCLFIPSVVSFIVMIWAGEVARMYRAGSFLAMREKIINRHIDAKINSGGSLSEPLGWEIGFLAKMPIIKIRHPITDYMHNIIVYWLCLYSLVYFRC